MKQPDFTIGAITIRDSGQDVKVLRVRALTSPNLQFLGAITTWPRNGKTSAIGSGLGYPATVIGVCQGGPVEARTPTQGAPAPAVGTPPWA